MNVPPPRAELRPPRRRVAIVGGGLAGLTAAFELSRTPEQRARYEVTVYQMGHRLGGKLASGRAPDRAHRNEEHGLHVWFGFYENTFRLADQVWAAWRRPLDCPFAALEDALTPIDAGTLLQRVGPDWREFSLHAPRTGDRPGQAVAPTPLGALLSLADLLRAVPRSVLDLLAVPVPAGLSRRLWAPHGRRATARQARWRDRLADVAGALHRLAAGDDPVTVARVARIHRQVVRLHRPIAALARATPPGLRVAQGVQCLDLLLATIRGLLHPRDGVLRDPDLDRLDDRDLRAWLSEHGAAPTSLRWIGLEAMYDAFFQCLDGDRARPDFAAGTALRVLIRFLGTYKRAIGFLLDAGAGEVLIAPLYEVLRDRGVQFALFHRFDALELNPAGQRVEALRFARQARVRTGAYDPLYTFRGLRCWTAEPDWAQLVDGDRLRDAGVDFDSRWGPRGEDVPVALTRGEDFDDVVLALPVGALREVDGYRSPVRAWLDAVPRIRAAVDGLNLVPSMSLQLWTREGVGGLGWHRHAAVTNHGAPASVWADMSDVLASEGFGAAGPRGLLYLCGVHPTRAWRSGDPDARIRATDALRHEVIAQLERDGHALFRRGGFRWDRLWDPLDRLGAARLDAQYLRLNVEPTDLCDSGATGTVHLRPEAHDSGLANLAIASTWARTPVNTTCVEAACCSGIAAARALGADVQPILGEGFLARPATGDVLPDVADWLTAVADQDAA